MRDVQSKAAADGASGCPKILCDCDGTLFQHKPGVGFHKALFVCLKAAQEAGFEVIIVSADPSGNQGRLNLISNHLFGRADMFGEIRHKSEFDGVYVTVIFDDDHSTHRVKADAQVSPTDDAEIARIAALLKNIPQLRVHIDRLLGPASP